MAAQGGLLMLRPAAMVHVEILLARKHLLPMAEYLGQKGTIHLTRSGRRVVATPAESLEDSQTLETYRRLCERIARLLTFFDITPIAREPHREATHITRDATDLLNRIECIETEVEEVQEVSTLLTRENERMAVLRRQIEPMASLDIDLHLFGEFQHVAKALGTVPTNILPRLRRGLADYCAIIIPLTKLEDTTVIAAFAPVLTAIVSALAGVATGKRKE